MLVGYYYTRAREMVSESCKKEEGKSKQRSIAASTSKLGKKIILSYVEAIGNEYAKCNSRRTDIALLEEKRMT